MCVLGILNHMVAFQEPPPTPVLHWTPFCIAALFLRIIALHYSVRWATFKVVHWSHQYDGTGKRGLIYWGNNLINEMWEKRKKDFWLLSCVIGKSSLDRICIKGENPFWKYWGLRHQIRPLNASSKWSEEKSFLIKQRFCYTPLSLDHWHAWQHQFTGFSGRQLSCWGLGHPAVSQATPRIPSPPHPHPFRPISSFFLWEMVHPCPD